MNRPRTIVHQLASLDGRLTLAPDVLLLYGDERWQAVAGGGEDAYQQAISRYKPQAILEGSGSFSAGEAVSDPLPPFNGDPAALYQDFLPEAIVHGSAERKWFTVVDGRGRVRWAYKVFPGDEWKDWHLLVLVARQTPPEYLSYLREENIPYLIAGEERVDLAGALEKLATRLDVTRLLSTGGGRLNGALLRLGLVDELSLEFFPALVGGFQTPSLFDSPELETGENPTRLKFISAEISASGWIRAQYEVLRD